MRDFGSYKYKKIITVLAGFVVIAIPAIASAHVVVTPTSAKVAQELVFSVSVPNERQSDVTSLKLDIPNGVTDVSPTVKPGWTVTTAKNGDEVDAVTWSGGKIPAGQRDDFSFGAEVPGTAAELDWKAFQTYADGTVVHWDQKPAGADDAAGNAGPYSVTHVVDDFAAKPDTAKDNGNSIGTAFSLALALVALIFSIAALQMVRKKLA